MSNRASGASLMPGTGRSSFSPRWKQSLRRRVLGWFAANARPLPWRANRDPYAIWISEIMLQQTQVATVIPYYERFLKAFPDIPSLAGADEQQVLRLWEGLGYYRRARQLHRAAKTIMERHQGQFPRDFDDVMALPGIGRYTAGAVLSFALDQRLPILEANTIRLYSRLLAFRGDPRTTAGQRMLWSAAEAWLPKRHAGDFNQGMMELGGRVCTIRPRCDNCPVMSLCPTRARGWQSRIPRPARRPEVEEVVEALIAIRRNGRFLLARRADNERWAGMWDFPRLTLALGEQDGHEELANQIAQRTGIQVGKLRRLTTLKHGVTRFRITLHCYEATARGRLRSISKGSDERPTLSDTCWISPDELSGYAMNVTARKLARLLQHRALS